MSRSANGKRKQDASRQRDLTELSVFAEVEKTRIRWSVGRTAVIAVGLAVVCLALTPVARALAGQQTVLNVSITLAISITLAVTLAMTGVWGHKQKKRADGAEDALQRCQHEAVDTVKEAKDAKERVEMLQLELADVRAELRVMAKGT